MCAWIKNFSTGIRLKLDRKIRFWDFGRKLLLESWKINCDGTVHFLLVEKVNRITISEFHDSNMVKKNFTWIPRETAFFWAANSNLPWFWLSVAFLGVSSDPDSFADAIIQSSITEKIPTTTFQLKKVSLVLLLFSL